MGLPWRDKTQLLLGQNPIRGCVAKVKTHDGVALWMVMMLSLCRNNWLWNEWSLVLLILVCNLPWFGRNKRVLIYKDLIILLTIRKTLFLGRKNQSTIGLSITLMLAFI